MVGPFMCRDDDQATEWAASSVTIALKINLRLIRKRNYHVAGTRRGRAKTNSAWSRGRAGAMVRHAPASLSVDY